MKRRTSRVTLAHRWVLALGFLVLLLGLGNLGRMGGALVDARHLPNLPMTLSWTYLAAMGGFWGAAFIACAVGLAFFRAWGRWGTLAAVTLYEAHVWLNHLLFDANDTAHLTWARDALLTVLLLALTWGLLNLPGVRRVFKRARQALHIH